MPLVIPGLADVPCHDDRGVAVYDIAPGARFDIHPLVPLPADLVAWGQGVVAGGAPEQVRVLAVSDKETELGWPVTIVASERLDAATGAVVEHRVHALFRFLELGGIAVLRAGDEASLAHALELVRPLVGDARPDFTGDAVPALALIWAGL